MHWVPTCSRHGPSWAAVRTPTNRGCCPDVTRRLLGLLVLVLAALPAQAQAVSRYSTAPYTVSHEPLHLRPGAGLHARRPRRLRQGLPAGPARRSTCPNPDGSQPSCLTCGCRRPTTSPPCARRATGSSFTPGWGTASRSARPATAGSARALCVMRPDGSHVTQLTGTDAAPAPARARTTTTPTGRPTASRSCGPTSTGTSSPAAARASGTCAWPTSSSPAGAPHLTNIRVVRPGQRPLVRDAVVGARRQRLPLHRDLGHGDGHRALLLPADRGGLPRHPADQQPVVERAGGLHARQARTSSSCRAATIPASSTRSPSSRRPPA